MQKKSQSLPIPQDALERIAERLLAALPPDFGKTGTLDELVAQTTDAANLVVGEIVRTKMAQRTEVEPEEAPICPDPDCSRGKKGGARGRSKSVKRPS
jgi:hypothetical protein